MLRIAGQSATLTLLLLLLIQHLLLMIVSICSMLNCLRQLVAWHALAEHIGIFGLCANILKAFLVVGQRAHLDVVVILGHIVDIYRLRWVLLPQATCRLQTAV